MRLVKKLVVRGTISFCNNKSTILPVGESVVWNVQCDEMKNVEGELFHF